MPDLGDLTSQCIRCGFCLESCPTFTETGDERESPRGRIYLVRGALEGKVDWQRDVRAHLDQCLGCRACETACPSGVRYGQIFEHARDTMERQAARPTRGWLLHGLTQPRLLRMQLALARLWPSRRLPGFVSRLLSGQPAQADTPRPMARIDWPPLTDLPPVRGRVHVLTGCAMGVLYDPVHEATCRLLRRAGFEPVMTADACCGALHAHNGRLDQARERMARLADVVAGDDPLIVNSAGCGSTIKDAKELDPRFESLAQRTFDICEFLVRESFQPKTRSDAEPVCVTYHDACHLAHGQRVREAPRTLLRALPGVEFRELAEADTCCGSAGIYNLVQPDMARRLLERKWKHIEATKAQIVATGNPGCLAWIDQAAREHGATVRVMHTAELIERVLSGQSLTQLIR